MNLSYCRQVASESCMGFWIGFLLPTTVAVTAKLWIMASGSQKTVSEIFGGIDTFRLRRDLATAFFVGAFTNIVLMKMKVPPLVSAAMGTVGAYALVGRINYIEYRCVQVLVIITSLGLTILEFKSRRDDRALLQRGRRALRSLHEVPVFKGISPFFPKSRQSQREQ